MWDLIADYFFTRICLVMLKENAAWTLGQEVSWPKVGPYTITRLVGEAGNIHIAKNGRYHVYWHRDISNSKSVLIHHGGSLGFDSLKATMHQHERVILRYTGLSIRVPADQIEEVSPEEKKEGIPIAGLTFPELLGQMETLDIPGEQQRINSWVKTLQDTSRDLPHITSHGELSEIREELDKLRQDLGKVINPHKKAARSAVEKGLYGSKGELLSGVNKAQIHLLERARQTVSIVVGTMQRYNALERLQVDWNRDVIEVHGNAGYVLKVLQSSPIDDEKVARVIRSNILSDNLGFEAKLQRLQGEPYFSRARQFIDNLHPLRKHWEAKNQKAMISVLADQAIRLELWKQDIKAEYTGVNFGKYNLG